MINKIISRIISAGIWAVFLGLLLHMDHVRWNQMGKEAFLAKEAARYDRNFADPVSVIIDVIACLFLLCIFLAIYEAIAFVIFKVLEKINTSANGQL
jgi:hypothetical protein